MKPRTLAQLGAFHLLGATPARASHPVHEAGPLTAIKNVLVDQHGNPWSYRGVSMFLLFKHWLYGENIDAQLAWCASLNANTVRVLGMVGWEGDAFGPGLNANWWAELPNFVDYVGAHGLRVEFTVFADAQKVMPDQGEQRAHLRRVVDTIGDRWNVLIEVANEPWQNGCDPPAIFDPLEPRGCPMAYGMYDLTAHQAPDGGWFATLPVLDYLTAHTPRDPEAWSRKAKDLAEYRDGSGDGLTEQSPLYDGCHIAPVGDEPMGAAEADQLAGRQRSNIADDFFWYHANAAINGAGSTFHCDAGLDAIVPPPGGDQQRCAEAAALAWSNVPADMQTGSYTRGGLPDLPLVWQLEYFPEQTSRIYGRILGNRAVCVGIKPNPGWSPAAAPGWRMVQTVGPMNSLVLLERG